MADLPTRVLRQRNLGAGALPRACFATQLQHQLGDLSGAGRPDGMTATQQTTTRVDGDPAPISLNSSIARSRRAAFGVMLRMLSISR